MATDRDAQLARLQAIMTQLLERRIGESLRDVDDGLARWRTGEADVFEAHAKVLRHAARTERLAARLARAVPGVDTAGSLLRDAVDLGVIEAAEFRELMGCEPSEVEPSPPLDAGAAVDDAVAQLPDKQQVVEELLGDGAILLHIDARQDGVSVPDRFRGDCKLVLRFGMNLAPQIPDLAVDGTGVSGTLRFGGVPHRCELPWRAIYAVVSEADSRGLVWPDDVPDEVVGELAGVDGARRGRGGGRGPGGPGEDPDPPDGGRPGHLRLVK